MKILNKKALSETVQRIVSVSPTSSPAWDQTGAALARSIRFNHYPCSGGLIQACAVSRLVHNGDIIGVKMAILYNIFTYTKGGVTGVHLRGVAYKGGELLCRVIYYRVCAPVRCCLLQGVRFFAVLYTTGCALLCGVVYFRVCAPLRCRLHSGVYFSAVSPTLEGCFSAASSTVYSVYRGALLRCVTYSAYEILSRPPPQRAYSVHLAELLFTWMDLLFSRCWGFGGLQDLFDHSKFKDSFSAILYEYSTV